MQIAIIAEIASCQDDAKKDSRPYTQAKQIADTIQSPIMVFDVMGRFGNNTKQGALNKLGASPSHTCQVYRHTVVIIYITLSV